MRWETDRQCNTVLVLREQEAAMLLRLVRDHIRIERELRDINVKFAQENPNFEDAQEEAADSSRYVAFLEHFISIAGDPEKGGVK